MTKQIQDAYIVSAVRTPVGKAPRGVFRNTRPDDLLAHVIRAAVAGAPGIDPSLIEDAIIGCAMPEGEQGLNVARVAGLLGVLAAAGGVLVPVNPLLKPAQVAHVLQDAGASVLLTSAARLASLVPVLA